MPYKLNPFTGQQDYYEEQGEGGGGTPGDTVVNETSFGQSPAAGSASEYSRRDHTHGSPTNPITAHEGASDPHTQYQKESEKGAANGYASLDAGAKVPDAQIPDSITRDTELSAHASASPAHAASAIANTPAGSIAADNVQAAINELDSEKSPTGHDHSGVYEPANANIQTHIVSTSNPHSTTKEQVGLGNADNTSDANKPVSSAQQTALDGKISHSLATAINDFLVASGVGVFVKKTLAEVKTILGLGSAAYTESSAYAPAAQGVSNGNSHDHNGGDGAQIDHVNLANKGTNTHAQIDTHVGDTNNPHSTSDANLSTSDIATNNVSITKHGFAPKAPNDTTKFLKGDATWSVPPYTLQILVPNWATLTDGQTNYFGGLAGLAPNTTGGIQRMYIPRAGTITKVYFIWQAGTAGTGENISIYLRKNNTSDTLLATVGNTNAYKEFTNTSLNVSVVAGDYIEFKIVAPTWATNPANVRMGGVVYIE